jgi:hypothetical protein
MDLRSEDYAARGDTAPSTFGGYRWVQVCDDCGTQFTASLLDRVCLLCDPVGADPYRKWDR